MVFNYIFQTCLYSVPFIKFEELKLIQNNVFGLKWPKDNDLMLIGMTAILPTWVCKMVPEKCQWYFV